MTRRWWAAATLPLALVAALGRPLAAQVLPPIYRPLPTEEQERYRVLQRAFRDSASARRRNADSLGRVRDAVPGVQEVILEFERRAAELQAASVQHRNDAAALQDSSRRMSRRADTLSTALGQAKGRRDSLEAAPVGPPLDSARLLPPLELQRRLVRDSTDRLAAIAAVSDTIAVEQARKDSLREASLAIRDQAVLLARDAVRDHDEADRIRSDAERLARTGNEAIVRQALDRSITYERGTALRFLRMVDSLGRMLDDRQTLADRRWLPVRSIPDAKLYYGARGGGRIGYLRGATATYDNRRGASANVDLLEYYVDVGRLSWTVVWNARPPSSDTAAARSALDRFLLGGGDLALAFMAPFAFQRGDGWSLAVGGDVRGAMSLTNRGPFPLFDSGLILYGGGANKWLGEVTFAARAAMVRHDSDIIGAITQTRSAIPYGQFTAGWELHNLMKVVVSTTVGPAVVRRALAYTIQFKI